jgi:hypothetical protein
MDEAAPAVDAPAGGGFKKRARKDNGKARKTGAGLGDAVAEGDGDGEGGSAVVRVVKARKESALGASTATRRDEVNPHRELPAPNPTVATLLEGRTCVSISRVRLV